MVRRLCGDNEISLLTSLRDSTVRDLELMIASVSATSVLNLSSLRMWPSVFSKPVRILLALWKWPSQTPSLCQEPGSIFVPSDLICSILQEIISYLFLIHFFQFFLSPFSVPANFFPLSHLIDLTLPHLAMNLCRGWIKESVSLCKLSQCVLLYLQTRWIRHSIA